MIERSGEVIQFKKRLQSLSHQRFSGEVDNALMMDTLRKLLGRQIGQDAKAASAPAKTREAVAGETSSDDDIGPVTKAVLIGIMLVSVVLIVMGLMQK